jgi:tetratricopeptide (TPR) repeat protein
VKRSVAIRVASLTLAIAGVSHAQSETPTEATSESAASGDESTAANEHPAAEATPVLEPGLSAPPAAAVTAPAPEPEPATDAELAKAAAAEAEARELFILGDRLYAEGDYEAALRAFERAYAISGRPALRYNMANAHERLGQYREALVALVDYLPHVKGENAEVVQRRILQLDARTDEVNATNAWGYGLLGAGIASLGVGGYFGIKALSLQNDINALCGDGPCPDSVQPLVNDNDNAALAADIMLAAGVVATGLGVYFVVSSDSEESSIVEGVQYSVLPGGGEVSIIGTF